MFEEGKCRYSCVSILLFRKCSDSIDFVFCCFVVVVVFLFVVVIFLSSIVVLTQSGQVLICASVAFSERYAYV